MNAYTCNTHSIYCWFYCVNLHKATFNSGKEAEKQNNLNNSNRNLGHCGVLSSNTNLAQTISQISLSF